MPKSILTVGLELASDDVMEAEFNSKVSLLDWDIVLFRPLIGTFLAYSEYYMGKPRLSDTASFQLKESCAHWRREIKQAVEAGKTVVVFLSPLTEVYVDTGERSYSGTGRSTRTTLHVTQYTNYEALPAKLSPVSAQGTSMKLGPRETEVIAPYWKEFGPVSEYQVILAADTKGVCLITKSGDRPVGAIFRSGRGALVTLPDIKFSHEDFTDDEGHWSEKAEQFANRMIGAVVELDQALRAGSEITPPPVWAGDEKYALAVERTLRSELLEAERRVEDAQRHKEQILTQLQDSGRLRALLYEKGKPLERAIIEALRLFGFAATRYKEALSEFDVVFECGRGRLLGEAEGKDGKAVNVDKLRQLSMNIHEDLQRDEVETPAKGVLFGNGFRFTPPEDREPQFTLKCVAAAQSSGIALVATSDLYLAARYLANQTDDDYATRIRNALLNGVGLVALPPPPATEDVPATIDEKKQTASRPPRT